MSRLFRATSLVRETNMPTERSTLAKQSHNTGIEHPIFTCQRRDHEISLPKILAGRYFPRSRDRCDACTLR